VFHLADVHKVRITVLRRFSPSEVFKKAPATFVPPKGACEVFHDGQQFIVESLEMPNGFCTSAWTTLYGRIQLLAFGGNLPWFKEEGVSVSCCMDGMRPVVFKLERI
jgi:uncharacterized repeat protein (TIGR04076 family)